MKSSKFPLLIFLLIFSGLILSACGGGDEDDDSNTDSAGEIPIFEDFLSGTIDAKWTTAVLENGSGPCTQSAVTFALEASQNYPATSSGDCGLEFFNSAEVASYSAEITVTAFSENPDFGPIRARLRGVFYNDGTDFNAGFPDLTSDIFAQIYAKDTVVEASVSKCTASNCASVPLMPTTVLGTITLGSTHTLLLGWDGVTTFTFQLDSLTPLVFDASTVGAPFAGPAIGGGLPGGNIPGSKVIELRGGSPAADGSIAATFDNIRCATVGGGACGLILMAAAPNGDLYLVDETSAATTLLLDTSTDGTTDIGVVSSMLYFSATDVLWLGTGNRVGNACRGCVMVLDPSTGIATMLADNSSSNGGMPGLAMDSAGNVFSVRGDDDILASVDSTTGLTTEIDPGGGFGSDYGGSGMTFDSSDTLYIGNGLSLYSVNTADGVGTFIGSLTFVGFPSAPVNSQLVAMATRPSDGTFFGLLKRTGGSQTENSFLVTVNPANAEVTYVAQMDARYDGLAFVPSTLITVP